MRHLSVFFLMAASALAADFISGQAARLVIGQPRFTAGDPGASQTLLGAPSGLAFSNNKLYIADANRVGALSSNNRVMIYDNLAATLPGLTQEMPQGSRCPVCNVAASTVIGQPDFSKTDQALSQAGMRTPTAVASDGTVLAVADTDNNRVLIWKTIPTANGTPADLVVGQADFTSNGTSVPPTAKSLRGPQGVWIQDGKLYIADTQNHRVVIFNSIPTSNGAAADLVLGQPNLTTFVEPDLTQAKSDAHANNLLNPVSVTSDGVRLYVTDLGHNRVLIWNSLPTQNQQPADIALGQPDLNSAIPDNAFTGTAATASTDTTNKETPVMCTVSNGKDPANNPTYPALCGRTMSFPRYAISDGTWLFVADGGNDRVLVYRHVPTQSGAAPDLILGEPDEFTDNSSDSADSMATPSSLAWDGTNLFVSDTYNRRVMVFSPAEPNVPIGGVRNAASLQVYAVATVTLGGSINDKDVVTVTIGGKAYNYTVVKSDTFDKVVAALVNAINAGSGDPNALATPNTVIQGILLTARKPGVAGNSVTLAATVSSSAKITATASGANLSGGQNAAQIGPGTLLTIYGTDLNDGSAAAPGAGQFLPTELNGTRVYIDGIRSPLLYASAKQVNAQLPLATADSDSVSIYVWTRHQDGSITVTVPVAVSVVPENPGIFATGTTDPRPAVAFHSSPYATGTISVDGSVNAGDVASVTIASRNYTYTVQASDTLSTIRDGLVKAINNDPQVHAFPAGVFTRIRLEAKVAGKAGDGITFSAKVTGSGAKLLLTPTSTALCCANTGLATTSNPLIPGETITVYATGLGLVNNADSGYVTGRRYDGPGNEPVEFVSSLAGGKTANVLLATPARGMIGVWELQLELNSSLPDDPLTQLTIAQSTYVSNIVTIPVKNPPK